MPPTRASRGGSSVCDAVGCYVFQYSRMQLWSLTAWVFALLLITFQWIMFFYAQFCEIRGVTGGVTSRAAPSNFQNVSANHESMCGNGDSASWPNSTAFMLSYVLGHVLATLNFKKVPCETVLFFVIFVTTVLVGCAAMFYYDAQVTLDTAVLYGFLGVLFVAYVVGTLVHGRPHFRQNLRGLDPQVKRIAKKYFVLPSAMSIAATLYELACTDEAWNARVSVNHDIEDPANIFCTLSNMGPINPTSHNVYAYCTDDAAHFSSAPNVSECESLALKAQSEFFSFNNGTLACQTFNFCNAWAGAPVEDGLFAQTNWTGYVRCDRVVAKYWGTIAKLDYSHAIVIWGGNILVAVAALAMRRIYRLDPYFEGTSFTSSSERGGTNDGNRFVDRSSSAPGIRNRSRSRAAVRTVESAPPPFPTDATGCIGFALRTLNKIDSYTVPLTYTTMVIVTWMVVIQPPTAASYANAVPLYTNTYTGWLIRAFGDGDGAEGGSQPLAILAYVMNVSCCIILGFGAPLAALLSRWSKESVIRAAVAQSDGERKTGLSQQHKARAVSEGVYTEQRASRHQLNDFIGDENDTELVELGKSRATSTERVEVASASHHVLSSDTSISRPGLRRVLSDAAHQSIDEAVMLFRCISEMPQIAAFVDALTLFDRQFRRGLGAPRGSWRRYSRARSSSNMEIGPTATLSASHRRKGRLALIGSSIDALVEKIRAVSLEYSQRDCELVQQRLREPHKAVYCMAMIGVVQEAQFNKFVSLATRLEKETEHMARDARQEHCFDPELARDCGLTDENPDLDGISPAAKLAIQLYVNAQRDKWLFDHLLNSIATKTDAAVQVAPLKRLSRTCEKLVFKGLDPVHNVNRVFDVVRGYLVFPTVTDMLMALNHLLAVCTNVSNEDLGDAQVALAKGLPRVRLVRVKNRLLHPTEGGWSDVMINLQVERPRTQIANSGEDTPESFSTICELQLINQQMHTIRHKMDGHRNYVKFRTAKEVLALRQMQADAESHSSSRASHGAIARIISSDQVNGRDRSPSHGFVEKSYEWVGIHNRKVAQEQVDVAKLHREVHTVIRKMEAAERTRARSTTDLGPAPTIDAPISGVRGLQQNVAIDVSESLPSVNFGN
eukprot:INCI10390.2.p1 GENE.INCI10390.2~~INCI10390.2.p1  ORF type:complete len:1121 (-),score=158.04 INCI10390.2:69-3431(-)